MPLEGRVEGLDLATLIPLAVVLARLVVPLFIPAYPLPAILAAMVLDAVDQTIFSLTLDSDLEGYQTYDKALDIYYLAIAYVSTIANWVGGPTFVVGRFLWYYRLVGVALFESTGARWLLFVFPNTFEYFFDAIEAFRVARNPIRLAMRAVIGIAAFIWIFIKLPQEWWIHIAQLDFTDFMKETVFGVPATSSWTDAITASPLVTLGLVVGAVLLLLLAWWAARRYLPPADWPPTLSADRQAEHLGWPPRPKAASPTATFDRTFVEKVILLSLIAFIFSRMLPGIEGSPLQVALAIVLIIGASTLVSQWLARRAVTWASVAIEFTVMTAVNAAIGIGIGILLPGSGPPPPLLEFLFLIAVLSLVVVLYDRSTEIGRVRRTVAAG
jgi:hypothetical protein